MASESPTATTSPSPSPAATTGIPVEAAATITIQGAHDLAWSPAGGPIAITAQDGLHLVSPQDLVEAMVDTMDESLGSVAFDISGQHVATADLQGDSFQVWDPVSGNRTSEQGGFINGVFRVFYGLDNALYVTAQGSPGDLWIVRYVDGNRSGGGSASGALGFDTQFGFLAAVNPKGDSFAVVGQDGIQVWDMGSPDNILRTLAVQSSYDSFVYSPDGDFLAVANSDCSVTMWNASSGVRTGSMAWCDLASTVTARSGGLAFNRDGSLLAAGGTLGQVDIWKVSTGRLVAEIDAGASNYLALDFSPGSDFLVTLDDHGNISLWPITSP